MYKHADFNTLVVYEGAKGERAKSGSFFVPTKGQTLSHIASMAYGSGKLAKVLIINASAYNRKFNVYRTSSSNCSSKAVNSDLALSQKSWNDGAWLAVCAPFPIIWIPTEASLEPEDLSTGGVPDMPKLGVGIPGLLNLNPTKPEPAVTVTKPPSDSSKPVDEQKAGFPWWLGAIGAVLAIGGLLVIKTDKSKR